MVAGRSRSTPSSRHDVTSRFANYSQRTVALSRWLAAYAGDRKMLGVRSRSKVGLPVCRRKAVGGSSSAAQILHAHPITGSGPAPLALHVIVQH